MATININKWKGSGEWMVKDNLKKSNAAGELFRGLGGVSGIKMHGCCDCDKVSNVYQSYDY